MHGHGYPHKTLADQRLWLRNDEASQNRVRGFGSYYFTKVFPLRASKVTELSNLTNEKLFTDDMD